MELDRRVGHLEPSHVDSTEEIVWERGHFAAVDHKVVHLVTAEPFHGLLEHLRILDVATMRHHLNLRLLGPIERAVQQVGFAAQVARQTTSSGYARGGHTGAGAGAGTGANRERRSGWARGKAGPGRALTVWR